MSAVGWAVVNWRMAVTTADVRFSIAYIAFGSVAVAWTVAWCGIIRGRVVRPLPPFVPVAVLVVSVMVVEARVLVKLGRVGAGVSVGRTTPVRASKMSDTGGMGSL